MRILIVAVGTRGDVDPYTGLAARLIDAGHEVTIAAYATFAKMIVASGARFHPVPGDPHDEKSWAHRQMNFKISTGPIGFAALMRTMTEEMIDLAETIRVAAQGKADVLLLPAIASLGYHVAEYLRLPSMGVYLQPMFPTAAHPPSLLGFGRSLGPIGNRAAGHLVINSMGTIFGKAIKTIRQRLDLPPLSAKGVREQMESWPVQHCYSPTVLPRPQDWRPELDVAGYLWPVTDPGWQPSDELAAFLDDGPPPVFVGFGSRKFGDGAQLSRLIAGALDKVGARGVIQAGWGDLAAHSDRMITIGEAPYSWLFPKMAALVHHAGAGTSAAGLLAGVPTVSVPVLADQPFWGSRMAMLGVGPRPVPHRKLTVDRLAGAIGAALAPGTHHDKAKWFATRLADEDGAGQITTAVEKLAA